MAFGENIRKYRKMRNLTQEELAEKLDVSFQAVSSWEREEYAPDVKKLLKLSEVLDVSLSDLAEERKQDYEMRQTLFEWEHMKSFVKITAKSKNMTQTLRALDFALKAHEGQYRKKSEIPYIYHPLNMACHLLAMGIEEDSTIAACLLHDVLEDCEVTANELPVAEDTKQIVTLLSKTEDSIDREAMLKEYFFKISRNPQASLIKAVDRVNNLTTMSWGLSRERNFRMIKETEEYVLPLLKVIQAVPEYNNAAWLLKYQLESMLDIYKRLL